MTLAAGLLHDSIGEIGKTMGHPVKFIFLISDYQPSLWAVGFGLTRKRRTGIGKKKERRLEGKDLRRLEVRT